MRALQVDSFQRRRGTWQTGAKVSAQARPSQWDSIRLVILFDFAITKSMGEKSIFECAFNVLAYHYTIKFRNFRGFQS